LKEAVLAVNPWKCVTIGAVTTTAAVGDVDREDEVVAGGSSRGLRRHFSLGGRHAEWVLYPYILIYESREDTVSIQVQY
jgi:hypothetical protein